MRLSLALFKDIVKSLDYYSKFNPSPLSIKQLIDFGKYFLYLLSPRKESKLVFNHLLFNQVENQLTNLNSYLSNTYLISTFLITVLTEELIKILNYLS